MTLHLNKMSNSEDRARATGRTTRIILAAILKASENPNTWVTIRDHWRKREADTSAWYHACTVLACMGVEFDSNSETHSIKIKGKQR